MWAKNQIIKYTKHDNSDEVKKFIFSGQLPSLVHSLQLSRSNLKTLKMGKNKTLYCKVLIFYNNVTFLAPTNSHCTFERLQLYRYRSYTSSQNAIKRDWPFCGATYSLKGSGANAVKERVPYIFWIHRRTWRLTRVRNSTCNKRDNGWWTVLDE